jgi:hypothetical protein
MGFDVLNTMPVEPEVEFKQQSAIVLRGVPQKNEPRNQSKLKQIKFLKKKKAGKKSWAFRF